ncbi:PCI-domain-containing protein [Rhodofomes roseus]|uniref:Eukaryotic translation initiation factor 3 subunit M n=1 Tax=Rhodofomes roseus TaxID=34475 RepID=A0ABQ8K9L7_9APHY|nr:PCI-domain-containing protein [Rhodofomes roseus]KAH9833674.1 PCI-domain-containing protein [Rhodofomes roseus]
MATADAVSVFAEGTFQEQIRELVDYIARTRSEEERPLFVQPFADLLETTEGQKPIEEDEPRRAKVFTTVLGEVKGLGDGADKEIEGFFNLLVSHFVSLLPLDAPETKDHLAVLLQTIATADHQAFVKYRILSNLYNALPRRSSLRLPVYKTLLQLASDNEEIELLSLDRSDVEKWVAEWDVPSEDKSSFLQLVATSFAKCGQLATSYDYTLSYIRSLPSDSPVAQAAAVDAIAAALRLPSLFDFDTLFRLDAVVAAQDHELFSLLRIFINEGLPEFQAWAGSHADAFAKYDFDQAQLERKIRLLGLTSLAYQNIGKELSYSTIATTIQIEPSQVERWVIDVIRAGLVSGRLSQKAQTWHVTRATARSFERSQWELLEQRLHTWKTGIASVLDVVATARRRGGVEAVATATTAEAPAAVPQAAAAAA